MVHPNPKIDAELVNACVLLGLTPPFTAEQAKVRFRELAKIYHPDAGVAKDSARFAKISHAYDLIESNIQRLAGLKLSFALDGAAATSQVADLLHQLHEARAQNLKAEKKLDDRTEELATLRKYVSSNRNNGLKRVGAIILFCIAALFLGFLAGMIWSAQSPVVPLKLPQTYKVLTANTETTTTHQIVPLGENYNYHATIVVEPDGQYQIDLTTGTAGIQSDGAEVKTSPTIKILKYPTLNLSGSYFPVPTPIPAPTATPAPSPTPVPPPLPVAPPAHAPPTTATLQSPTQSSP